jgi:hypothetical protein
MGDVWARRLKAVTSHRPPKCYPRELLQSWHKIQRYLEEIKKLTPEGVSYRLRDLCWTSSRTAASKRAKSVEP